MLKLPLVCVRLKPPNFSPSDLLIFLWENLGPYSAVYSTSID